MEVVWPKHGLPASNNCETFDDVNHPIVYMGETKADGNVDPDLEQWLRDAVSGTDVSYDELEDELENAVELFEEYGKDGYVVASRFEQATPP